MKTTKGKDYTEILERSSYAPWKQTLDVQRPYRWNIKRLNLGRTLDIGCGIGRILAALPEGSVGVDHNAHSIALAKSQGLDAWVTKDFVASKKFKKNSFDSLLMTHVLEHLTLPQSRKILEDYLPYVKSNVVVICPQEKGYKTDDTHITFLDAESIEGILKEAGLDIVKSYSFPFTRNAGKVFTYNETVVVAKKRTK